MAASDYGSDGPLSPCNVVHTAVSLRYLEENSTLNPVILTPRSLQACHRCGILQQDLTFLPLHSIAADKSVPLPLIKLRFEHHESWRKEMLADALREYEKLLSEGGCRTDPLITMSSPRSKFCTDPEEEKLREGMHKKMDSIKRTLKGEVFCCYSYILFPSKQRNMKQRSMI